MDGTPLNSKPVSISDVATAAGVSPSTVSRALNSSGYVSSAVRERIERVAEHLGYIPDPLGQSLRTRRTKTIAVVIPDINNVAYASSLEGIEEVARTRGYEVVITCPFYDAEEERRQITNLRRRRVDGFVFVHGYYNTDYLRQLRADGFAVVAIDRDPQSESIPLVSVDYVKALREAVIYMHGRGHTEIGYFAVSEALRDPTVTEKYQGYLNGLAACGLELDSDLVYTMMPSELNQIESARRTLVAALPNRRRPTAILAGSDYIAFGLIRGLRDLGMKVPDEVSIMGCENIIFAEYMEPPLTTLTLRKKEKGTLATEMLITMIEDKNYQPDARTLLETPIVERESVKLRSRAPEASVPGAG